MTFTPKFADLVRNVATVSGTGPVTLGAAVSGFDSLADAVGAGEQFYYCLQSLDKVQEREVGRGTMQSDGRVARQPIAGSLTNFTNGTKTIALVAPAEWFSKLDGAMTTASTRSELSAKAPGLAYLSEAGRAGDFMFDPTDLSAMVAADPAQGVYVAPPADATGASGAWVRQGWKEIDPRWFGAVADDDTDCSPAINAAFRLAEALAVAGSTNGDAYRGGPAIRIGAGKYYCASTWEPLATIRIQGAGGLGWGAATQVRFPAGVTGVRAQAANTSGADIVDAVGHFAGDALVIQDIYFIGGFAGVEGEFHGLHAKRAVHVERCTFDNFQGDGFHALTNFGGGAPYEGNSNVTRITNCVFTNCRNGISAEGDDANAWTVIGCSLMSNRQWGIKEDSFLGNHHFGHHFDANARTAFNDGTAGKPCAYVSHGGHQYFALNGQEAWCSANAPSGTSADNQGWGHWCEGGPAGAIPAWFDGISVRAGGPLLINGLSNKSTATGLHIEINGVSQLDQGAFVSGSIGKCSAMGGLNMHSRVGTLTGGPGGLRFGGNLNVDGDLIASSVTNNFGPSAGPLADSTLFLENNNAFSQIVFRRNYPGGAVEDADMLSFGSVGLMIRGNPSVRIRTKYDNIDRLSVDGSGIAVNGGVVAAGAITSSGGGVGYSAGAGGSAAQTGSKSTAVTLNTFAGQIAMNGEALAAGAVATFTVNNNRVEATDTINLSLQSGNGAAGAYRYWIEEVAAEWFKISVENRSGGPLSEALTFNFAVLKAVAA